MLLDKKSVTYNYNRKHRSYYISVVDFFMSTQERLARGEEREEASYRGELGKGREEEGKKGCAVGAGWRYFKTKNGFNFSQAPKQTWIEGVRERGRQRSTGKEGRRKGRKEGGKAIPHQPARPAESQRKDCRQCSGDKLRFPSRP